MSKRRAVILSVTVEKLSQADTARLYGVSTSYVSRLLERWRTDGDAAFEPRSRRPKTSPTRTPDEVGALVLNLRDELTRKGLDAGPQTIAWHVEQHHGLKVSTSTIRRRLIEAGRIEPQPRKRPKSSYIRFEAAQPNECWPLADGSDSEILA